MKKIKEFFKGLIPSKRRLIQVYAALLYNANLMGFVTGNIFVGKSKMVCLPGMNCYSCPGAIGACPLGSLQTALSSKNYKTITYLIGILLLYSIILGRTICGWLCPGGLFQELLYKIKTPKLKKNRITRILSYFKYVLLVVLVIYIPIIFAISAGKTIPAFCKYICPIGTFEGAIGLLSNPNNENYFDVLGPLFTWKFILLIIFIVASIFIFRFFCRFFCPLGAIYGLFNKLSILGIKVNDEKCNGCNACVNHCKMDVKHVGDHECIMCGDCIDVCHANAIDWKLIRKDIEADYEMNKDNSNDFLQENVVEETKPTIIEEAKPKKKNKKRFIINLTTTILATSLLVAAILYSNVNWSKDIGVKREETITELSINTYDDEVFELDNKYTFIYFFDNFNEEEFLANYSVFEGKDVNFIAVSSYSNRELNQKYFDTSLNVTYAYDTEDNYLLRKFSGNKYPYYAWLDNKNVVMDYSNTSFESSKEVILQAIDGKKVGNKVGDICIPMDMTLMDKDGNISTFNVANTNGKVRVINFWYTQCGPCVQEMPYFNNILNNPKYADLVDVYAFHAGEGTYTESDYLEYLNKQFNGFKIKFGLDTENSDYYYMLGGNSTFPMTVIVDAEGIITYNSLKSVTVSLLEEQIDIALNN